MSQLKAKIKRADFFNLVSQANSLIEKRSVMPILSKILISAKKEGGISIQATDQDNSLQSEVSADVESPGQVVVDTQNLYDILKELPEGMVKLSEHGGGQKVKLVQGSSVFNLLSLKVQDFPAFPPFRMEEPFFVKRAVLKNLIEKTAYCASVDETRYNLTGVFFEVISAAASSSAGKKKEMFHFRFVATDGHRLGMAEHPCEKKHLKSGVIISRKGVQEIKKLISHPSSEEEVEVAVTPPRILFRYKNTVLSVKLVEGNYPRYQPLIPQNSSVAVELETEIFSQALRRVSLLSSNNFKGVNFHLHEEKVQMEAENPELGSARDEIPCKRKKGEDLKVRFNARYVLEALNSFGSQKVLVEFGGKESPCVISPVLGKDDKKQHSLCVVMPMKM